MTDMAKARPELREARRKAAEDRNTEWHKLTPEQQLKSLDLRLGKGQGATKQRLRIQKRMAEQKK